MASRFGVALARNIAKTPITRVAPITVAARSFHQSKPTLSAAPSKVNDCCSNMMAKIQSSTPDQRFLWSSIALGVSLPLGLVLSPTVLAVPFDFVLGFAMPYHLHTGLNHIVDDYVKKPWANTMVTVLAFLVALGFLKINLCGVGLSESIKSLWRKPQVQKK